jgi:hypothetical protein
LALEVRDLVRTEVVVRPVRYPVNELALKYNAGVEHETTDPREAYARFGEDKPVVCPVEFPDSPG